MSLTMGAGPFGGKPAGEFNFRRTGPDRVLFWDPTPKRHRVEFGGVVVADSGHARLLHERDEPPRVYFPRGDVRLDRLAASDLRTRCPIKGEARYWSTSDLTDIAWSYEQPEEGASFIAGFVSFDLDQADAWYEEDEPGYAHPRDPYHRVDVLRAGRHVRIRSGDTVIGEADRPAMLFETSLPPRFYLAPGDVRTEMFERSETVSQCPYKGPGQHWHLALNGVRIEDAAWSLAGPIGDAVAIPGWWSFYPDKLIVEVNGDRIAGE